MYQHIRHCIVCDTHSQLTKMAPPLTYCIQFKLLESRSTFTEMQAKKKKASHDNLFQ